MKRQISVILAVAFMFSSGAARADWEYTKWGMTPEQVISASQGLAEKIVPLTREYRQRGKWVRAPHKLDGLTYDAVFRFELNSKGLDRVQLTLKEMTRCEKLVPLLIARYGDTKAKKMAPGWRRFTWSDKKSNSQIRFTEGRVRGVLVSCGIEYSPIN